MTRLCTAPAKKSLSSGGQMTVLSPFPLIKVPEDYLHRLSKEWGAFFPKHTSNSHKTPKPTSVRLRKPAWDCAGLQKTAFPAPPGGVLWKTTGPPCLWAHLSECYNLPTLHTSLRTWPAASATRMRNDTWCVSHELTLQPWSSLCLEA